MIAQDDSCARAFQRIQIRAERSAFLRLVASRINERQGSVSHRVAIQLSGRGDFPGLTSDEEHTFRDLVPGKRPRQTSLTLSSVSPACGSASINAVIASPTFRRNPADDSLRTPGISE